MIAALEKSTPLSLFQMVRTFRVVLNKYLFGFLSAAFLIAVTTSIEIALPWTMGKAVDEVITHPPTLDRFWIWCYWFLGLVIAKAMLESLQAYVIQVTGQGVTHDLRTWIFSKMERLPVSYFDVHSTGRSLTRVINDVRSLSELFTASMSVLILDAAIIVGTAVALFVLHWKLALWVLFTYPFLLWVMLRFGERLAVAYREVRTRLSEINSFLGENVGAIATIQRLGAEESRLQKFGSIVTDHQESQIRSLKIYALVQPWTNVLNGISMATLLALGGYWVVKGEITLGIMVASLGYLKNLFQPIRDLVEKYNVFLSARVSAERIAHVFQEGEEKGKTSAQVLDLSSAPRIKFEGVTFRYPTAEKNSLKNVNLNLEPGTLTAIVGPTGGGKSTLIRLLLRFYEPDSGKIYLGDKELKDLDLYSLRRSIGYIPQEIYVFEGTLRDNLTLGREGYTDEFLIGVAKRSKLWGVIENRGGLDLHLQEGGNNLSLGERQLLSFTRILCFDPPVLVLDEATASLDNALERQLLGALDEVLSDRTCLVVAHRLSTVEKADYVCVIKDGEVEQEGTYQELATQEGLFAKLAALSKLS